jgi:Rrf2 family protein
MLREEQDKKHTVVEMAKNLDIPKPFLSKIMQQLSKSGLISSTKGRGGGFYLSSENKTRPLIDVIECIEGKNVFQHCILGLPECSDDNPCILHNKFGGFRDSICQSICEDSIKDLLTNPELNERSE